MRLSFPSVPASVFIASLGVAAACGGAASNDLTDGDLVAGGAAGVAGSKSAGGSSGSANGGNAGSLGSKGGASGASGGSAGAGGMGVLVDPTTCAEAEMLKSYVGCDYWPTVVTNAVWSIFDYAVIVANTGVMPAQVTVDRKGMMVSTTTVAPGTLEKIYLPWVPGLKGPDNICGTPQPFKATVGEIGGAYHLVSTAPVTVYQFNALEYRGAGGPPGKSWSACPGTSGGCTIGCFSFSNDASILLPTTAMTGNYRVSAPKGQVGLGGGYIAITATQDATHVKVKLSATAQTNAGAGLTAHKAGDILALDLNRGDVVELFGADTADLSGSQVAASAPVQVISGIACANIPVGKLACDHLEESVFPAETLGQHYVVTSPTGPQGNAPGHIVRFVGNVDGTKLTYLPSAPAGAPATLNAGQVAETMLVTGSFEVKGDHEFVVATFMPGAEVLDPNAPKGKQKGDPSMSLATAVEQYRRKYVFLAPDDYDVSFADLIVPTGATVTLDGAPLTTPITAIASGFGIARVKLGAGNKGAHTVVSDKPVGVQVMGYGDYTSYQYPGGLNLVGIAPPPPDPGDPKLTGALPGTRGARLRQGCPGLPSRGRPRAEALIRGNFARIFFWLAMIVFWFSRSFFWFPSIFSWFFRIFAWPASSASSFFWLPAMPFWFARIAF